MKSKFKFWAYFVAALALFFSLICGSLLVFSNTFNPRTPIWVFIIVGLFFAFVWSWLVLGELRTKVVSIHLDYNEFSVRPFLGIGLSKTFYFSDIEGYKISLLPSKTGTYEYLYLMSNNRKVVKLSEYYHSNYSELKAYLIERNVKNLGFERFSNLQELKEMFS